MEKLVSIPHDDPRIKDRLDHSLHLVSRAFETAQTLLQGWGDRYDHLKNIVDASHLIVLPDDKMTQFLSKTQVDIPMPERGRIRGLYTRTARPEVDRDTVLIRESILDNPKVLLHEFIHRAGFYSYVNNVRSVRANREFDKEMDTRRHTLTYFDEGMTHWSTRYLADTASDFSRLEGYVRWLTFSNLKSRGFDESEIDLMMLDYTLTEDVTPLEEALKVKPESPSIVHVDNLPDLFEKTYIKIQQAVKSL